MGTKTSGSGPIHSQGVRYGGKAFGMIGPKRIVTGMPCDGNKTTSKIHIKTIEKKLEDSSLLRCETAFNHPRRKAIIRFPFSISHLR
jgi:hypothetical protein